MKQLEKIAATLFGVVFLLAMWGARMSALVVLGLMVAQLFLMNYFVASPTERALLYSGFGVPLFVAGMMVSAFALRGLTVAQ